MATDTKRLVSFKGNRPGDYAVFESKLRRKITWAILQNSLFIEIWTICAKMLEWGNEIAIVSIIGRFGADVHQIICKALHYPGSRIVQARDTNAALAAEIA